MKNSFFVGVFSFTCLLGGLLPLSLKAKADTTKVIQVPASQPAGVGFRNTENRPVELDLTASGNWTYDPKGWRCDVGERAKFCYLIGPEGRVGVNEPRTVLPSAPLGSLIMRRGSRSNPTYEYVGVNKVVSLKPGETIRFLINDVPNTYNDNQGSVSITILCEDCEPSA